MSEQVNLLQQTKVVKKERSKLTSFSFLFLLITVVIAVGMLVYLFFLKNQERAIIDNQSLGISSLNVLQDKKIMYQSTKERLASITQVLQTKDILTNRFLSMLQVIPSDVEILSVELLESNIKITVASNSLQAINEFLEKELKELPDNSELQIKRIQVDSVGVQSGEGFYSVGVTIEFG